jgi:RNA polymerase sigma factor (sigma-70 family)
MKDGGVLPFLDPALRSGAKVETAESMSLLASDRDLLARFRGGDRDALERVFRHYAPQVLQFLRSGFTFASGDQTARHPGLSSAFDLESAVQETFARAFQPRARDGYDGLRPYGGFLLGIARHVALDMSRRGAGRRERPEPPDVLDQRAAALPAAELEAGSPGELLDARRATELVRRFLAEECDERDRSLYQLRYVDDLSQEQAASRAGLTRIRFRRWETKFRARLLRHLKRANFVGPP